MTSIKRAAQQKMLDARVMRAMTDLGFVMGACGVQGQDLKDAASEILATMQKFCNKKSPGSFPPEVR